MIGYFPEPYEDELLYSMCARFVNHLKPPSYSATMLSLFGTKFAAPVVELPNNLSYLASSLPPTHDLTADMLIDEYTLLPFYAPFLSPKKYQQVRSAMKSGDRSTCLRRGVVCERVRTRPRLRSCPICDQEDVAKYGEVYWRRLHQITGVDVCTKHQVFLEDSDIKLCSQWSGQNFVAATPPIQSKNPRPVDLANFTHQFLVKLAKSVCWLIHQKGGLVGLLPIVQQEHLRGLRKRGLAASNGDVIWEKVHAELIRHYTPEILRVFQIDSGDANLVLSLLWPTNRIASPLHHLLLIDFLGETVESFFTRLWAEMIAR